MSDELTSVLTVAKHAPEGFTTLAAALALWRLAKLEARVEALCDRLDVPAAKRERKRGIAASLLMVAVACLFLGCTVTEAQLSDGSRVKRVNWLFTTRFAEAQLRGTNGASVRLKGYSSDVEAVAEAVARGAVSGAKP